MQAVEMIHKREFSTTIRELKSRALKACYEVLNDLYNACLKATSNSKINYEQINEIAQKAEACIVYAALIGPSRQVDLQDIVENYMKGGTSRMLYRNNMMKLAAEGLLPQTYVHRLAELRAGRKMIAKGDEQERMLGAYHIRQAIHDIMLDLSEENE